MGETQCGIPKYCHLGKPNRSAALCCGWVERTPVYTSVYAGQVPYSRNSQAPVLTHSNAISVLHGVENLSGKSCTAFCPILGTTQY